MSFGERDPLDPPTYGEREDDFDADDIASADSFDFETVSGVFMGAKFADGSVFMDLHLRVTVQDAERARKFFGARGILTLEKPR